MATDKNFIVKNGLEVGGQEVISSSGVVSSAALGGQTLGTTDSPTFANTTLTGSLRGPATFTIDPAAVGDNTGTLVIAGNLQVDGTTTTINSTTMEVDDLNITLASGAANAAAANGAGITVDGASATITYDGTNDEWDFNKDINVTGTVTADGLTVDGDASISSANARLRLFETDTTDLNTQFQNQAGDFFIKTIPDDASSSKSRFGIDHSTGDISFYEDTGTTAKLFWDASAESLGIGTSSPDSILHIEGSGVDSLRFGNIGTSGNSALRISRDDTTISGNPLGYLEFGGKDNTGNVDTAHAYIGAIAGSHGAGDNPTNLTFGTTPNGSSTIVEVMRIDESGNVGIGQTSPSADLEIKRAGSSTIRLTNALDVQSANDIIGEIEFYSAENSSPNDSVRADITAINEDTLNNVALAFGTAANAGNVTERMRIDSSGNVGIGTSSPNADLHIGSANATGTSSTGNVALFEGPSGTNGFKIFIDDTENAAGLQTIATDDLLLNPHGGNVGIGTTSPASPLEISSNAAQIRISTASDSTNYRTEISSPYDSANPFKINGVYNGTSVDFVKISAGGGFVSPTLRLGTGMANTALYTGTAERLRIDSSGRLLVGKTAVDNTTVGFRFDGSSGFASFVRDGNASLLLVRKSDDGDILQFKKDTTTVGSIGTRDSGALEIGSGDVYLQFNGANDWIKPVDGSGSNKSGVDLGTSGAKFDNLYLSGTASIGNLTIAGAQGSDGQLLTSTGSGIAWEDAPAGGPTFKTFGTDSIMIGDTTTGTINAADENVGVGVNVFASLTTGDRNVALGHNTLTTITTSSENTAVGYNAGKSLTTVGGNAFFGNYAGEFSTGASNTFVGNQAGKNSTGSENTAFGGVALRANVSGTQLTAIGKDALRNNTASANTAVGFASLKANTSGTQNNAFGSSSLTACTTGSYNVGVGQATLANLTTGSNNVAVGDNAMQFGTTEYENVAVGVNAGRNYTGRGAVSVGYQAAYSQTASSTVAIGEYAAYDSTTSDDSVYIGRLCGENVTTGFTNVMMGDRAGQLATTGAYNVFLGYKAGDNVTTGSSNIVIGSSNTSSATSSSECTIPVTTFRLQTGSITNYSDARDKSNVEDSPYGLEFLEKVKLRKWLWDCREEFKEDNQLNGKERIGFVAQELLEVMNEEDNEVLDLVYESNPDRLEVRYSNLLPIALKAIQELSTKVKELEEKLND